MGSTEPLQTLCVSATIHDGENLARMNIMIEGFESNSTVSRGHTTWNTDLEALLRRYVLELLRKFRGILTWISLAPSSLFFFIAPIFDRESVQAAEMLLEQDGVTFTTSLLSRHRGRSAVFVQEVLWTWKFEPFLLV